MDLSLPGSNGVVLSFLCEGQPGPVTCCGLRAVKVWPMWPGAVGGTSALCILSSPLAWCPALSQTAGVRFCLSGSLRDASEQSPATNPCGTGSQGKEALDVCV